MSEIEMKKRLDQEDEDEDEDEDDEEFDAGGNLLCIF
jgi:hypothetical protein